MTDIATGPGWELRLGDYREVLADVRGDAVITDPPYSARTHKAIAAVEGVGGKRPLEYGAWTEADIRECLRWADGAARGWTVMINEHTFAPAIEAEAEALGRYQFAPLPFVEIGKQPRMVGGGPASWTCQVYVSRPRTREWAMWRSLDGAYVSARRREKTIIGGKPLWLMRALVRDYTRRGDVVIDPCAGAGTTLLAALTEGRTAIGAEIDRGRFEMAAERLRKGYTVAMDFGGMDDG